MTRRDTLLLFAGFTAPPATSPTPDTLPEADYLLRRGRRLLRVVELLRAETKRNLDDWRLWARLGCACAGRVASLAYAAAFTFSLDTKRAQFSKHLAEWEAAQKDTTSFLKGTPKPVIFPSRAFATRDDSLPFTLTMEQSKQQTKALIQEARHAWEQAERIAPTPQEKAEAAYLHGWGLRLVDRHKELYGPAGDQVGVLYESIPLADIVGAFERAIAAEPQNALYHRALGDFYHNLDSTKAEPFYRDSLRLEPRNPGLWYRLYQYAAAKKRTPEGMQECLSLLQQVARCDRSNAWPAYEETAILLRQTQYSLVYLNRTSTNKSNVPESEIAVKIASDASREAGRQALEAFTRGNSAPACFAPVYTETVPRWITVPWQWGLVEQNFLHSARFRELVRAVSGYALALSDVDDIKEAVEAARAVITFGNKIGAREASDKVYTPDANVTDWSIGLAAVTTGYMTLALVYEKSGQTALAQEVRANLEIAKQQQEAFNKAIRNSLDSDNLYSTYIHNLR